MNEKSINELSHELIGAAIEVHRLLGPGLLETASEGAYSHALSLRAIPHVRQKMMPVTYKGAPDLSARSAPTASQLPSV